MTGSIDVPSDNDIFFIWPNMKSVDVLACKWIITYIWLMLCPIAYDHNLWQLYFDEIVLTDG